jgi:hypothetical protein
MKRFAAYPAYRRDMPLNRRRQRSPERVLFDAPAGARRILLIKNEPESQFLFRKIINPSAFSTSL